MARYKFGGTAQDGVYSKFAFAGKNLLALADATVTAWAAKTGGTQHTDLLDAAGNPVTSIKVTDGQLPEFSGPDGVTELWVDDGDTERHLLVNRQVGPQGPAGPGGSDADVAGYVNTAGTQTRTAVDARAQATLDTHLNDTVDAHDATAISYAGSANLAATNVEAALDELDAEKAAVGHTHGGWVAWPTPTLVNFTGTINEARYISRDDGTVSGVLVVTLSAAPTGVMLVVPPVPARNSVERLAGSASGHDAGTQFYSGVCRLEAGASPRLMAHSNGPNYWNAALPFAWGPGDILHLNFTYEKA